MQSGRLLALISLLVPLSLPSVCAAQGSSGLQIFTSYDNSFPGGAGMGGFGLTLGSGPAAIRTTFGFTLATLSSASIYGRPANSGLWTGDIDFVISGKSGGRGGFGGGGIQPYGFLGIGAHSVSNELALDPAVKTWSLGGGLALPLSPTVSLDGEVRNRMALAGSDLSSGEFVNGAEFRVGLTFHFGGGPRGSGPSRPRSGRRR